MSAQPLSQAVLNFNANGFEDFNEKKTNKVEPKKGSRFKKNAKIVANLSVDCCVSASCIGVTMAAPQGVLFFTAAKPFVAEFVKEKAEPLIDSSIVKTEKMASRIRDASSKGSCTTTSCFKAVKK